MEQEWLKIYEKATQDTLNNLKLELSEAQMQRVELLVDEFMKFNKDESFYFMQIVRNQQYKAFGIDVANINVHWP